MNFEFNDSRKWNLSLGLYNPLTSMFGGSTIVYIHYDQTAKKF